MPSRSLAHHQSILSRHRRLPILDIVMYEVFVWWLCRLVWSLRVCSTCLKYFHYVNRYVAKCFFAISIYVVSHIQRTQSTSWRFIGVVKGWFSGCSDTSDLNRIDDILDCVGLCSHHHEYEPTGIASQHNNIVINSMIARLRHEMRSSSAMWLVDNSSLSIEVIQIDELLVWNLIRVQVSNTIRKMSFDMYESIQEWEHTISHDVVVLLDTISRIVKQSSSIDPKCIFLSDRLDSQWAK